MSAGWTYCRLVLLRLFALEQVTFKMTRKD